MCKLNRLLEIEADLESTGRLKQWEKIAVAKDPLVSESPTEHPSPPATSTKRTGQSPGTGKKQTKKSSAAA